MVHWDLDTGVTFQDKEKSFNEDAGNSIKKSKMFHFSLQCWQHGEDLQASGGWDRLMVKCQLSL